MRTIYTIGYAGYTIDSFLDQLQRHGIQQVIDIRRVPQSRKPGFSKSRLSSTLAGLGIVYVHLVDLGTPPIVRANLRETGDYTDFFDQMERYLTQQPEAVAAALDIARQKPSVVLCLEANYEHCHRAAVVNQIVQRSKGELVAEHI
ncbi:MAG: DUF488 domain-containing protein [Herpetosiphon sp.]